MIDLSFYREHGYQVLRDLFPRSTIEEIQQFLEKEVHETLGHIQKSFSFRSTAELIGQISTLFEDEQAFNSLDPDLKNMLCGHFSLKARLNPLLHLVPKCPAVQEIYQQILPGYEPRMHLPPTARFILPNNRFAGVPAHQDVSYNKHVDDFFVLWVPFCNIDEQCGGVRIHHGSGHIPELLDDKTRKFWLKGIPDQGFDKIHCTMKMGSALLLNKWVIHESVPNTSNRIRFSSDFRFFGGPSEKHYLDMKTWQTVAPEAQLSTSR